MIQKRLATIDPKLKDWWQNKVCLITGSTAGIGLATARTYAHLGAEVHIVGRNPEKTQRVITEIIEETGNEKVMGHICDLAEPTSIQNLAKSVRSQIHQLHLLVNIAGIYTPERKVNSQGTEKTWATNYLAYYQMCQLFLPLLKQTPHSQLINMSGETARCARIYWKDVELNGGYSAIRSYAQSKLAIIMMTKTLAEEIAAEQCSVKSMHPGPVATDHLEAGNKLLHQFWSRVLPNAEKAAIRLLLNSHPDRLESGHGRYYFNSTAFMPPLAVYSKKKRQRLSQLTKERMISKPVASL